MEASPFGVDDFFGWLLSLFLVVDAHKITGLTVVVLYFVTV